jgi:hypothetical protein
MNARATVRRARPGAKLGEAAAFDVMLTDEPCRIICETTSTLQGGFGRVATGRWSFVFRPNTIIKANDRITIKKWDKADKGWKQTGLYEIDTALMVDTHTEATGIERG